MKKHFIHISIDNLPDDVNKTTKHMPENLDVSLSTSCNDLTCALLLTTLIRRLSEDRPKALEIHQVMLANDYFHEVSIDD